MRDSYTKILIINTITYLKSVFLIIALLLMVGCGGWFEEDVTGQFIDGPVAGLTYVCSSGKIGVTKKDGKFTCKSGDTVAFKVGNTFLGTTTAEPIITPVSLYPGNPEAATNVAQLLQTLDDDGDLSSFVIDEAKAAKLTIYLDVTSSSFEESAENMLGTPLVDASSAVLHMNESIAALPGAKLPTLVVTDPVVTDPVVADPVVTDPVVADPVVTDPVVADPVVTDPIVADPVMTDPIVADPVMTDPIVADPVMTDPVVADPVVTDPVVAVPVVTDPVVTDPVVTDPVVAVPVVTDPIVEPAPSSLNLITNGTFDNDVIDWTGNNGTVYQASAINGRDNVLAIADGGAEHSSATQSFSTVIDTEYEIVGLMYYNGNITECDLRVYSNGWIADDGDLLNVLMPKSTAWETLARQTFTATTTTTTIGLMSRGISTAYFDEVLVRPVDDSRRGIEELMMQPIKIGKTLSSETVSTYQVVINTTEAVTYSIINKPGWLTIDTKGLITMSPVDNDIGDYKFEVIAYVSGQILTSGIVNVKVVKNPYLEIVTLPECDKNNPEVQLIATNSDWSSINDPSKRIFCVKPGKYSNVTLTADGTSSARRYILLDNGDDAHPASLPESGQANVDITMNGANYWVIDRISSLHTGAIFAMSLRNQSKYNIFNRIHIQDFYRYGVTLFDGSNNNTIQHSRIADQSLAGRKADGVGIFLIGDPWDKPGYVYNTKIIQNELKNCNDGIQLIRTQPGGTTIDSGYDGTIIDNNHIFITSDIYTDGNGNHTTNGNFAYAENAIDLKAGSDDANNKIIITNNYMWGFRVADKTTSGLDDHGSAVSIHFGTKNIVMNNNIIFDSAIGFSINNAERHAFALKDATVNNNILWDIQDFGIVLYDSQNVTVESNIVHGADKWGSFTRIPNSTITNTITIASPNMGLSEGVINTTDYNTPQEAGYLVDPFTTDNHTDNRRQISFD